MKTSMTTALLAIMILVSCNTAPKKQSIDDAKAEILRILEVQETAYDNQTEENKSKFIATCTDSLIFIGGDDGGMMMTPKAHVGDLADGYSKKPYNRKFQFYDNTAIVVSLQQAYKLLADDTLFLNVRYTKIFVRENEQWKMAYVTYAPLPVLYNKTTTIDPNKFAPYTGVYDLGEGLRDSVFVEDGKVYSDINHSGKSEILALNDTTFIGDGYFGRVFFAKNGYTFEWNDGQRIKFKKVR